MIVDRVAECIIAFAVIAMIVAVASITSAASQLVAGSNAATREQVYQACVDEFDTSTATTYEEYETMVPRFIEHAKECERKYLHE